jgi:hypothetical protein
MPKKKKQHPAYINKEGQTMIYAPEHPSCNSNGYVPLDELKKLVEDENGDVLWLSPGHPILDRMVLLACILFGEEKQDDLGNNKAPFIDICIEFLREYAPEMLSEQAMDSEE